MLSDPCTAGNQSDGTGGAAYYTFDFSKGSKGWDVEGPANFKYNADTGNTAPCVSGLAKKASGSWYFKAPASVIKALNQNKSYGRLLLFDLLAKSSGDINEPAVIMEGYNHKLVYNFVNNPTDQQWTTYTISLSERGGWRNETTDGTPATRSQIKHMLLNVNKLLIRGKFNNETGAGYLDNVTLE